MKKIEDYLLDNDDKNRMIQKALREASMSEVMELCVYLKEHAQLIFRNMSERAVEELKSSLEREGDKIPQHIQRRAYVSFQKKLLKYEDLSRDFKRPENFSSHSFNSLDEIRESILVVHILNARGEVEELNNLIEGVDNLCIKKMLKYVVHAYDLIKAETHMERQIKEDIEQYSARLSLVKRGISSILAEESIEDLIDTVNAC